MTKVFSLKFYEVFVVSRGNGLSFGISFMWQIFLLTNFSFALKLEKKVLKCSHSGFIIWFKMATRIFPGDFYMQFWPSLSRKNFTPSFDLKHFTTFFLSTSYLFKNLGMHEKCYFLVYLYLLKHRTFSQVNSRVKWRGKTRRIVEYRQE